MALGNPSASTNATNTALASSYPPPQQILEVEKYPQGPPELSLQQVHVYVRHGERAPVGVRMSAPPASIPEHWMLCQTARHLRAALRNSAGPDTFMQTRRVLERRDGSPSEGECFLGELTDVGRQSALNFGLALRKIYVDKLGFLPNFLGNRNEVYFRSTNIPRTIESLEQVVHGMYPVERCHPDHIPPILVRNGQDEDLVGNGYICRRLELLKAGFARAAASSYNPLLESLNKRLSQYIGGHPVRVDGSPRASGILDTIRAAAVHGIKVPPEFEEKPVMNLIERAVVTEWFSDKTEEVRRLGMGRMLDTMSQKMQHKVDHGGNDPLKMLVYSTHDTGIAGLLCTFDVFDDKWPDFTASVTFELFKRDAVAGPSSILQKMMSSFRAKQIPDYFVRMRYQNKNMALPMCADEGKHLPGSPEFCLLKVFRDRVKELTPLDYEAECSA
ncbi:phosphoglycerate mutase-like protein [Fistulina hepatica ATCC 64428]|uniref:Phosphoglycerate mutase-like protein n=1 Tax=Fistulina hepatica ATCC 64428 TaxID=1128425 RepID=A0A0D7AAA1_9AGAR|nr:phosphoglycerate mutase-like protein [Fistulina hepatica ATCC 64428]